MGLQKKISLWFAGVLVVVALVGYAGLSMTLRPAFDDLENRASLQDLARVRNNLEAHQQMLFRITVDWGQWDEAYRFMLGTNPEFVENNFEIATLVGLDVNLMLFYNTDGELQIGMFVDSETGLEANIENLGIDSETLKILMSHPSISAEVAGLVRTQSGPMLVSARPITWSNITGPALGTLVVGRLLDAPRIAEISSTAEVALSLMPPAHVSPEARSETMFGEVFQTVGETLRNNDQVLHDVVGRPVATLHVTSPRDVSMLGMNTMASVLVLFASLGVLTMLVLALVLRGLVTEPISRLKAMMVEVEQNEDVSGRVELDRSDEIGGLADSFNDMLTKLELMKQQNIEQSFKAGMAEVAAGVLHNVRNALMPVMNNVAMARDQMKRRSDKNVTLAIEELGELNTDNERHQKLLEFVSEAHQRSVKNRAIGVEYLGDVLDKLDHAAEILKDQEKYTHAKPVLESVKLGEVVGAARGVIPANVLAGIDVDVKPGVDAVKVKAHRVGLMQVIGNLLVNAVESISRKDDGTGTIWVDAIRDIDTSKNVVVLTIRDDGIGIEKDELQSLFDRGYSTKDGSRGEGLHWSANALAGMGGEISARSDGAGRGAEFRIVLQPA